MKNYINYFTAILFAFVFASCSNDDDALDNTDSTLTNPGSVNLTLDAVVGSEDFELGKTFTINDHAVRFDQFRYWVSNVSFLNTDGERIEIPNSYYLMEENEVISIQDGAYEYPAKKRETINLAEIPAGDYDRIEFSVGIDSTYNNNLSLQSGELSQLNGMTNISWMWHTSYIFTSLKGMDLETDTPMIFETGLNESVRTVVIPFDEVIEVNGKEQQNITIKTDIAAILQGVDFKETPIVGASTPEAMTVISDNFESRTFILDEKENAPL